MNEILVKMNEIFQIEIYYTLRKTHNRTGLKIDKRRIKIDKRRKKIATKVPEKVKTQFPENVELINDRLEQECQKENMSVDEVIFLHFQKQKVSVEKYFLFGCGLTKAFKIDLKNIVEKDCFVLNEAALSVFSGGRVLKTSKR